MQTELVFDPRTHAHTHDPETSHVAAKRVAGTARRHCDLIQQALEVHRRDGLTASEIVSIVGLEMVQVNRRISDLVRDDRAHRRGETRPNRRGNSESIIYPGKAPE